MHKDEHARNKGQIVTFQDAQTKVKRVVAKGAAA
jgi:hypothetical protein